MLQFDKVGEFSEANNITKEGKKAAVLLLIIGLSAYHTFQNLLVLKKTRETRIFSYSYGQKRF